VVAIWEVILYESAIGRGSEQNAMAELIQKGRHWFQML